MVGECKGCGNCYFRRNVFVGGRGNPASPIVFVGEAPGATELSKGEPFRGPSGKVLADALPESWSDNDYWVTNAIQCLPRRGQDVKKNMADTAAACMSCRNRLIEEIKAYPRKVIVAMGNSALWALTGNTNYKITQERGKLFHSDLAARGIIATVHPAFLLRGGGSWRKFKLDIEYAVDLLHGLPEKQAIVPEWWIADDEQDVRDFIDETFDYAKMTGDDIVGADIETGGFNYQSDETLCLGWAIDPKKVFVVPEQILKTGILKYGNFDMAQRYGGPLKWTWHNGKFDAKFLRQLGYRTGVDHDTMLMSYTMEEQRGFHDLEQVANDEIGAPDYKDMLKPYLPNKKASYRVIPKSILYRYLALDVSNTKQIATRMHQRILQDAKNTTLYHKVLLPASECLMQVEEAGMLVDFDQVEANSKELQGEMEFHAGILNQISIEHGHVAVNPNAPAQLATLLFDVLNIPSKTRSTDADHMDKMPDVPAVKALKAYRKVAKAYGTYVKPLAEQVYADGRVHSTYLLHGTATGRLASRGPNMQNQPRNHKIRGQFVAPKGRAFCEMDLDQAELRCLAALSGDPELCAIYENGRKIHKEVSIDIWGPDWAPAYALDDPTNPLYQEAKEQYMRTKALNFGIIYGREAPSIAQEFEIPTSEAQMMIDGWARKFPVAWAFIQKCRMAPIRGQNLVTPFGRRKRAGVVSMERLKDLQNEAANFPHQSIASDITLMSAVKVQPQLKLWDCQIVNLIHDAILVELPDDMEVYRKMAAYVTTEMMKTPIEWGITRIKFQADAKLADRWGTLREVDFAV